MRYIIFHFHIFKNAGTSIDKILEESFGKRWAQIEGPSADSLVKPNDVLDLVQRNPSVAAISSHQAMLPPVTGHDFEILPIMMIRHPLDRVRSVYLFERKQATGSRGAEFASSHSFPEYVRWRLESNPDGIIHNFHSFFLLRREHLISPRVDEVGYQQAVTLLHSLFFGIVEKFNTTMELFNKVHTGKAQLSRTDIPPQNITRSNATTLNERLEQMRDELGGALYAELVDRNSYDLRLYEEATAIFDQRVAARL